MSFTYSFRSDYEGWKPWLGLRFSARVIQVLEVTMRDGNNVLPFPVSRMHISFRSDYEGWKHLYLLVTFSLVRKSFRSDYEGWKPGIVGALPKYEIEF